MSNNNDIFTTETNILKDKLDNLIANLHNRGVISKEEQLMFFLENMLNYFSEKNIFPQISNLSEEEKIRILSELENITRELVSKHTIKPLEMFESLLFIFFSYLTKIISNQEVNLDYKIQLTIKDKKKYQEFMKQILFRKSELYVKLNILELIKNLESIVCQKIKNTLFTKPTTHNNKKFIKLMNYIPDISKQNTDYQLKSRKNSSTNKSNTIKK